MNQFSPEQDRTQEQLCRAILTAANADDAQVEAAAEAPFLYQRIRNEIAAQESNARVLPRPGVFQLLLNWRWAVAGAALLLLAVGWWQSFPKRRAILVAKQENPATLVATAQPLPAEEARALPAVPHTTKHAPVVRRAPRTKLPSPRPHEVTTEFIPLTYVADATNSGGHVIRVEVTPALLASLGLPLKPERNTEWIKADVVLGDDGLARAIRFVQ